ncbi:MAG: hypothetical protein V4562_08265 [Pseudomonadota bacterium]
MASAQTIQWLHRIIWILIYSGLLVVITGFAVQRSDEALGLTLLAVGGTEVLIGAVLIWVRSRLQVDSR